MSTTDIDVLSAIEDEVGDAPTSPGFQSWARQETIRRVGAYEYGCWAASFAAACNETKVTKILYETVRLSQGAGSCPRGHSVLIYTHF